MKRTRLAALAIIAFLSAIMALTIALPKSTNEPRNSNAISTVLVSFDQGHGSGVHIGNGYIVTAAHVVNDRADMQVMDSNGKEQTGVVLWTNKAHDIALLRVADAGGLRTSPLVCKPRLAIGDELQAVGSPVNLQFVHTWGRVSTYAVERARWKTAFVGDITIAPGMSGGPVFDRSGGVVGIAVGVAVLPQPFAVAPLAISYIVPSSAVCMLMARSK